MEFNKAIVVYVIIFLLNNHFVASDDDDDEENTTTAGPNPDGDTRTGVPDTSIDTNTTDTGGGAFTGVPDTNISTSAPGISVDTSTPGPGGYTRTHTNKATPRYVEILEDEQAPLAKYKFVAHVEATWCESVAGTENCTNRYLFTATLLSHGYLLTNAQNIPCVLRYKMLYGDAASSSFTFRNLKFDIRLGKVSRGFKEQPSRRIEAKYPEDSDVFFPTPESVALPTNDKDTTMFCEVIPDLAIIFVKTFIEFDEFEQSIPILRLPIRSNLDENCIALAYNYHSDLRYMKVTVGDDKYCKQLDGNLQYPGNTSFYVCARPKDSSSICNAIPGSPLVCGSETSFYYLVGVLYGTAEPPGGKDCGRKVKYALYTYPGYFEKWLVSSGAQLINVRDVGRRARSGPHRIPYKAVESSSTEAATTVTVAAAEAMKTHPVLQLFCLYSLLFAVIIVE